MRDPQIIGDGINGGGLRMRSPYNAEPLHAPRLLAGQRTRPVPARPADTVEKPSEKGGGYEREE